MSTCFSLFIVRTRLPKWARVRPVLVVYLRSREQNNFFDGISWTKQTQTRVGLYIYNRQNNFGQYNLNQSRFWGSSKSRVGKKRLGLSAQLEELLMFFIKIINNVKGKLDFVFNTFNLEMSRNFREKILKSRK